MNFWEMITGSEMTKVWKNYKKRVKKLPADYQEAWEKINNYLWQNSDFTGRSIMSIFDGVLSLFEESALEGLSVQEVLGDDIKGFCAALIGDENLNSFRDKWRKQLNRNVINKLGK
jgi:DNA-binding ferritin-like protein (Dps family)